MKVMRPVRTVQIKEIDLLIGATAMEQWGMTIDPLTGRIDLKRLKKREFTEY